MNEVPQSTEARLAHLERTARRQGRIIGLLLTALVAGSVAAATQSQPEEIRARRFVAVNDEGVDVARLDADAGPGAVLELGGWKGLGDTQNRVRISMAFNEPNLQLTSGESNVELAIGFQDPFLRLRRGEDGAALLGLQATNTLLKLDAPGSASDVSIGAATDGAHLIAAGPNGEPGISMLVNADSSALLVDDEHGSPRAMLTYLNGGIGLHLFDSNKAELATLSCQDDFSGLSLGWRETRTSLMLAATDEWTGLEMVPMGADAGGPHIALKLKGGTAGLVVADSDCEAAVYPRQVRVSEPGSGAGAPPTAAILLHEMSGPALFLDDGKALYSMVRPENPRPAAEDKAPK